MNVLRSTGRVAAIAAFACVFTVGALGQGAPPPDNPFGGPPASFGGPTPTLDPGTPPAPLDGIPDATRARALIAEPDAVRQIAYFRFTEEVRWDGETIVRRKKLSFEESQAFDRDRIEFFTNAARAGTLPWYPATGADPAVWGEWSHYSEQLALWTDYVDQTLFADNPTERGLADIQFPGDPVAAAEGEAGAAGGRGGRGGANPRPSPENLVAQNQNVSIDDQAGSFFDFSTPGQQGQQNNGVIPGTKMDEQTRLLYNDWITEVRAIEKDQNRYVAKFDAALNDRSTARLAYAEWRKDQQVRMMDVAIDWQRRYDGNIADIEGVRYELYKPGQVPRAVPRGAHIVETNHSLTPFDILDDNGRLLGPAGAQ